MINPIYVVDYAGLYSYKIMFFAAVAVLLVAAKYNLLATYVFFYYITYFIIKTLKPTLREPRPPAFQDLPAGAPKFMREDLSGPIEKYGMPSGHAASTVYTLAFAAATLLKERGRGAATFKPWFFWMGGFIAAAAYYQRYTYNRHTAGQLFAGTVVGGTIGYIAIQFYQQFH